jgi:hypothetical protein
MGHFYKEQEPESLDRIRRAVESADPALTARLIAEAVLELDDSEPVAEIAADFIENEIGRHDWVNNWQLIRDRQDPVQRVQQYLDEYAIAADARQIVDHIDRMARLNPGLWK